MVPMVSYDLILDTLFLNRLFPVFESIFIDPNDLFQVVSALVVVSLTEEAFPIRILLTVLFRPLLLEFTHGFLTLILHFALLLFLFQQHLLVIAQDLLIQTVAVIMLHCLCQIGSL